MNSTDSGGRGVTVFLSSPGFHIVGGKENVRR